MGSIPASYRACSFQVHDGIRMPQSVAQPPTCRRALLPFTSHQYSRAGNKRRKCTDFAVFERCRDAAHDAVRVVTPRPALEIEQLLLQVACMLAGDQGSTCYRWRCRPVAGYTRGNTGPAFDIDSASHRRIAFGAPSHRARNLRGKIQRNCFDFRSGQYLGHSAHPTLVISAPPAAEIIKLLLHICRTLTSQARKAWHVAVAVQTMAAGAMFVRLHAAGIDHVCLRPNTEHRGSDPR